MGRAALGSEQDELFLPRQGPRRDRDLGAPGVPFHCARHLLCLAVGREDRRSGDRLAVDADELGSHVLPGEALRTAPAGLPHGGAAGRIAEHRGQGTGECARVAGRHEKTRFAGTTTCR